MVKAIAIIQARMSSSRLPGKVMKDLNGKTLIERVIDQVKLASEVSEVWLSTSTEPEDDLLQFIGKRLQVNVFRGSLHNVLKRFHDTLSASNGDVVVRVTADNPLTEPSFIDEGVKCLIQNNLDYVHFTDIPYGSGVEIVSKKALEAAFHNTTDPYDIEHVTPYIIRNENGQFKKETLIPQELELRRPDIHITIDTLDDYIKLFKLFYHIEKNNKVVSLLNAINYCDSISKN